MNINDYLKEQAVRKYIAFKVNGISHWFWFSVSNVHVTDNIVRARGGWGENGAYTHLTIPQAEIIGVIQSDELQYSQD